MGARRAEDLTGRGKAPLGPVREARRYCLMVLLAPGLFPPYVEGPVPLNVVGPDAVPFGLLVAAPPLIMFIECRM